MCLCVFVCVCSRCAGRLQWDHLCLWSDVIREDTHNGGECVFVAVCVCSLVCVCSSQLHCPLTCSWSLIGSGQPPRQPADGHHPPDLQGHLRPHLLHGREPGVPHQGDDVINFTSCQVSPVRLPELLPAVGVAEASTDPPTGTCCLTLKVMWL